MLDLTQFYFPFTSIDGDRRYNAKDFATYFHSIFTDGVIATVKDKLRVSQSEATGMHVVVNTGAAFIHGHLYLLGEPLTVDVTPGNSTGDRVDSIVLQLDHLERDMKILYKQNSTNVQRDENYWELQLATINVPRNATQVLNSQINDKRANEDVAGYSKLQGNLDVEGMEQHYESLLQQLAQDMQGWTDDKQLEFQTDWDTWFSTVQDALDGDTAGNLLSKINAHELKEATETELGHVRLSDIPTPTKEAVGLGNVDNVKQASKVEHDQLASDFNEHQADDATTSKKGHVQLSNATNSTSQTLAATPNAVKQAYDRANEAFTSASNGKELVGNAITGVDDSVVIPAEPTFQQLANAIGSISSGLQWHRQTQNFGTINFNNTKTLRTYHNLGILPTWVIIEVNNQYVNTIGLYRMDDYAFANPIMGVEANGIYVEEVLSLNSTSINTTIRNSLPVTQNNVTVTYTFIME